jgi:integrase
MSIYRKPRSPYWHFDFQWRGHRFHGSTKRTSKREAEKVEAAERERAKALIAQTEATRTSLRLDDVAGRYWQEHGQHGAGAANTERRLALMIEFFGKDKLLTEITGDDVARLVAWRRGHRGRAPGSRLAPHTVNHMLETMRSLFSRAKLWGVKFAHEPIWHRLMLPIPSERVRELSDDEAERIEATARGDYGTFIAFARASGLRLTECLTLRWSEVGPEQISKLGKGGKLVTVPITSEIAAILRPLRGHHPVFVFTYVCERAEHGRDRGHRYPLTRNGLHSYWRRLRKDAGITGLRFHDLRHDFGTKLLRETGNLKLVQRAMNHASITTTTRYAHVLDGEVAEAMEQLAKSRIKSRKVLKVV